MCGTPYPADYAQVCEVDLSDDWAFWCERHRKPAGPQGCEDCAYSFGGRAYFETAQLGKALLADWAAGKRHTAKQQVSDWLLDSGKDRILAGTLREAEREDTLPTEDRFALIVALLNGDGTFRRQGVIVDLDWLLGSDEAGLELLRSTLPGLIARFGINTWLKDLQDDWRMILAESPPDSEAEVRAFRLLFNRGQARDLSTALRIAALAPRLRTPKTWGKRSGGSVAKLAATISDTGFTLPSAARLKKFFAVIARGLRAGQLSMPDNRSFFECTLIVAWRYEGKTLLEYPLFLRVLSEHLQTNADLQLLHSLVFGYFRDFNSEQPEFVALFGALIREYLATWSAREFLIWKELDATWELFGGPLSPSLCAPRLPMGGRLEETLRALGLVASNLWSGFSAALLVAWTKAHGTYGADEWEIIRLWFEQTAQTLARREYLWIDALVLPWAGKRTPEVIRRKVGRYLIDRFGEPVESAPVWDRCLPEVRETVKQWWLQENLEQFFDLIAEYAETTGGEMRTQWMYRKAFWLAVHRTKAVSDLRVAAGKGILTVYGERKLRDRFGSKLTKLGDSDERRCALLLQIEDLTVVDFTHNAKCRVWETKPAQTAWLSSKRLSREQFRNGEDLTLRSHYTEPGISHFSSEAYGWQDALAEFLRLRSPVHLVRKDYEVS